jgi:GNAT superfamily N-acetyltransferase
MTVQPSPPGDRAPILALTGQLGNFGAEEVDVVAELFDGYLRDPVVSGYNFLSDHDPATGELLGFACWGPTSLSRGASDLYWIAAAPQAQQRGVGGRLFQAVEAAARKSGRWLIVIWTSSRPDYDPARRFYEHVGCELNSRIADFYDHGDDLVVYVKRL